MARTIAAHRRADANLASDGVGLPRVAVVTRPQHPRGLGAFHVEEFDPVELQTAHGAESNTKVDEALRTDLDAPRLPRQNLSHAIKVAPTSTGPGTDTLVGPRTQLIRPPAAPLEC